MSRFHPAIYLAALVVGYVPAVYIVAGVAEWLSGDPAAAPMLAFSVFSMFHCAGSAAAARRTVVHEGGMTRIALVVAVVGWLVCLADALIAVGAMAFVVDPVGSGF